MIFPDSSIWHNQDSFAAVNGGRTGLYVGTVREAFNDPATSELKYLVEVYVGSDVVVLSCRQMRSSGGLFNYEDRILQTYSYNIPNNVKAKNGDTVLVGLLGRSGREGVILGGMNHATRPNLKASNGPELKSEFNGVETYINKDGEFTQTFKGQPINLDKLDVDPGNSDLTPEYDTEVGSGFWKWDKTGGFLLTDNATSNPQTFHVDKEKGLLHLVSGAVSLKIDKQEESVNWKSKSYTLTSPDIKLGGSSAFEQAVFGTTYRTQETAMNNVMTTSLTTMATALSAASAALTAASADPVLAGLAPTAAAAIATAAGTIITAAAQATAMATAITTFEASAKMYLSDVVKVG